MVLFKSFHISLSDIKQRLAMSEKRMEIGETSQSISTSSESVRPKRPPLPSRSGHSASFVQLPSTPHASSLLASSHVRSASSSNFLSESQAISPPTSPSATSTRNRRSWRLFSSANRLTVDTVPEISVCNDSLDEIQKDTLQSPPRLGSIRNAHESSSNSLCLRQLSQDDLFEMNTPTTLNDMEMVSEQDHLYNLGCDLYASERYSEAFAFFVQIAQTYAKAAYNCGNMCRDGLGVQEYIAMLRSLMKEEITTTNSNTDMSELSDTEIKNQAAIRFYQQAINLANHPRAAFNLANIYKENGDISQAIALYKLACKEGHERSWTKLGNIYMSQRKFLNARKCYKKGMDCGHASAWRNMGLCYEKGLGVNRNLNLAYSYYTIAVEKKAHRANDLLISCGIKIVKQQSCVGML